MIHDAVCCLKEHCSLRVSKPVVSLKNKVNVCAILCLNYVVFLLTSMKPVL